MMKRMMMLVVGLAVVCGVVCTDVCAQGSSISYQGRLEVDDALVSGAYDFRFTVYSTEQSGTAIAGPVEVPNVNVFEGLFELDVDFGVAVWDGTATRFLQVEVRESFDGGGYELLGSRQAVRRTPRAVHALEADVAAFAEAGPFEPADTTPIETSGLNGAVDVLASVRVNGTNFSNVDVLLPVRLERAIQGGPGGPAVGQLSTAVVRMVRVYQPGSASAWRDAFESGANVVQNLEIEAVRGSSAVAWQFGTVRATGFGYLQSDRGELFEVLEITAIGSTVTRVVKVPFSLAKNPAVGGPTEVGELGRFPGRSEYLFDSDRFEGATAKRLPFSFLPVDGNLNPQSTIRNERVTMLSGVWANNALFDAFLTGADLGEMELYTEIGGGLQPVQRLGDVSIVTSWTLRLSDDGNPVEEYEIEFGNLSP